MGSTRPTMNLQEFLDWEEQQDERYESDGRTPELVGGGTDMHSALRVALCSLLLGAMRGSAWRVFNSDLKIEAAGRIRYPDAFVASAVLDRSSLRTDPVVVFEILSDSTAGKDRTVKNAEYAATPSVRRYVVLEQDCVAATVFARVELDWVGRLLSGPEAELAKPEIGVTLRLGDIYDGILGG